MSDLTSMADLMGDAMFSAVRRTRVCECGRTFTQMQMQERELEALERMGRLAAFLQQIPDGFVPVHCPPCETTDIGRQARIDEGRRHSATASRTLPDRRPA